MKNEDGVVETLDAIILLAISVAIFGILFYVVTTTDYFVMAKPVPTIVGYYTGANFTLRHDGGLSCDAKLYLEDQMIDSVTNFSIGSHLTFPRPNVTRNALFVRDDGEVLFFSQILAYNYSKPSVEPVLEPVVVAIENKTVSLNESFNVTISCVPNQWIKGYEYEIIFNPAILQVEWFEYGNIFQGFSVFYNPNVSIDNTIGNITLIYSCIIGNNSNTSENGTLGTIRFNAIAIGTSFVNITELGVCNETRYLAYNLTNGTVNITSDYKNYTDPNVWFDGCGDGGITPNPAGGFNLTDDSVGLEYCWMTPLNTTATKFTVLATVIEHDVSTSSYLCLALSDGPHWVATMFSQEFYLEHEGYGYVEHGVRVSFGIGFNAFEKTRVWNITIDMDLRTVNYSVYLVDEERSLFQCNKQLQDVSATQPKWLYFYSSGLRKCSTTIMNVSVIENV